ncbi:MAG: hypothetical protein M0R40_05820 [Firmicutes bacterium]|nr:hypothetical protein [Bacillota bacterium]
MQMLYFLMIAILTVLIYRLGLKDGQTTAKGGKITAIPMGAFKQHKENSVEKGLKNIISYGMGGVKLEK